MKTYYEMLKELSSHEVGASGCNGNATEKEKADLLRPIYENAMRKRLIQKD